MHPFAYARPDCADQAVAIGADPGSMFLAGGTELLNWMRLGIVAPERVIDISRLPELKRIESLFASLTPETTAVPSGTNATLSTFPSG